MTESPFDPDQWSVVAGFDFTDITYHAHVDVPVVRIAFDRPEVRNAFRPHTVDELYRALDHARMSSRIGAVLLTGNGPSPKDGGWAFCSGGDQRIRGRAGYQYADSEATAAAEPAESFAGAEPAESFAGAEPADASAAAEPAESEATAAAEPAESSAAAEPADASAGSQPAGAFTAAEPAESSALDAPRRNRARVAAGAVQLGRLHILEVQRLIRFMPKVVIALVGGWAAGGGHSLHVVCDLSLASAEHARFKQTDADVGSFDGGFGSAYLARQIGQKFAREIFFLGDTYSADDAYRMGMVNRVVPHADLERVGVEWARAICGKSPTAQRMLKFAFNAIDDGLIGQQVFAGETTRLAYMTDEAVEGRDAFLEKRSPDWSAFPYYF